MTQPLQTVRGMQDFLPDRSATVQFIESKAREVLALFGYREIRTPILESTALFERALGQTTDIVEKEMFTLKDRGDRALCLRPEGTAGVVRSFIENSLNQKSTVNKLYYMGPMFRAERPQAGRFRQFIQIGSEYFGNAAPSADAETIRLVLEILKSVGIQGVEARINSLGCSECRPVFQQKLLAYLQSHAEELCEDCRKRMDKNPLRALDCKTDSGKLANAPTPVDSLCAACAEHHGSVKTLLDAAKTPFVETPHMVRGLDYYTRTVFEFYAADKTGSQDALAAGGRYDGLVRDLGGPDMPAVGFALGLERVMSRILESQPAPADARNGGVFVAALGGEALAPCFKITQTLRDAGIPANGVLNGSSLKSQMRLADSLGARFCVIVGENELKENSVMLKDLLKQAQEKVPMTELARAVAERLKSQS